MKDVTVIVPVYNARILIRRCIDSILKQAGNYDIEIICIDDGSTDDSLEIIRGYQNKNIIIFKQPSNGGPAKARNKGIKEASGQYLAFLDADDYWEQEFLDTTIKYLKEHEEVVAVNVAQHHLTINGDYIAPSCYHEYQTPHVIKDFFGFWADYCHVCTGSALIRTEVAKSVGYQREELRSGEDWEFWMMVATYGNWAFIPKILFTSDGTKITKNIGWLEKMQKRWDAAIDMESWQYRLLSRNPSLKESKSYMKAMGRIARSLVYCKIQSKRWDLARREAMEYGEYFYAHPITKMMNIAKHTKLTWKIMCIMFRYREIHRNCKK